MHRVYHLKPRATYFKPTMNPGWTISSLEFVETFREFSNDQSLLAFEKLIQFPPWWQPLWHWVQR